MSKLSLTYSLIFVMSLGIYADEASDADFHLRATISESIQIAPIELFSKTYWTSQSRFGIDLDLSYYISDLIYMSHGLSLALASDGDLKSGLAKPGSNAFGLDFGIGFVNRPSSPDEVCFGFEGRLAAYYGQITGGVFDGAGLSLFWLEPKLKPFIRLFDSHFEIGFPLRFSLRRDPGMQFSIALELGAVL